MKKTICILSIVVGGLLALGGAGCHKQTASTDRPKSLEEGMSQLQAALAAASPSVRSNFNNGVADGVRYGNFPKAAAALQLIASDPSLTEPQKKLVNDVGELLKQPGTPNTPPPAR